VSWFFDAGFHVGVGDAEAYNLETWSEVRRLLGRQGKPILADPRDVLTRLYNSEINGCIAEVPGGAYTMALGDEHNGFDAEARADSWDGALQWLEGQARVCYPQSLFATHMSSRST
jgi:hypothetical protein